jgi:hypothetical protein
MCEAFCGQKGLPGSLDFEGVQALCFALYQSMLDYLIDAAAARTAMERCAQLGEAPGLACGNDFDIAVFGIANPAFQLQLAGFSMHEPSKAHSLYSSPHQKMQHHCYFTPIELILRAVAVRICEGILEQVAVDY